MKAFITWIAVLAAFVEYPGSTTLRLETALDSVIGIQGKPDIPDPMAESVLMSTDEIKKITRGEGQ